MCCHIMAAIDDLHNLDDSLRSIGIADGRRYQPLQLDKMFARAANWGIPSSSSSTSIPRPPSPPRLREIYPLPKPLEDHQGQVSPLEQLFTYPELLPLVLRHCDRPSELAVIARVNKEFCRLARMQLYESIWVRSCQCLLVSIIWKTC